MALGSLRTDVLLQGQGASKRNQGLNAMSQAQGAPRGSLQLHPNEDIRMRKSLIEVQPNKNAKQEQDSPFMQMIHAQQSSSGLSDVDKRMMASSNSVSPQKLGNFGGLMQNAAKQVVDGAQSSGSSVFVSDKLLNRQRQFKAAADMDLHQILAAQSQRHMLIADFSQLGKKGNVPQFNNRAVVRVQHVLPSIDDSGLYGSDLKERSYDAAGSHDEHDGHLAAPLGQTSDYLECDMLEETEPVNRALPQTEPASEEEEHQLQIDTICSQCRHGRVPDVKQAIKEGRIHVDVVDKHGNTLLIIACQNNHKKIVKFLIKQGADVTTTNFKGYDANHFAQLYKHKDICKYLS